MSYQLLLTNAGAAKIATASNAGGTPLHITDFAVGQGVNVDFSTRLDKQTLVAKRYQGKVESVNLVAPNKYEIVCVVPVDVGGFTIREFGLIDSDGVLVWVGSLPEVQKPDGSSVAAVDYRIKAVVQIDNPAVSIVVDANAVTATQSWVNNTISKAFTDFQALFETWKNSVNQDIELVKSRRPVSVGGLLVTTNNYANSEAVRAGEGYGVWTRYAEGRVPIGVGTAKDINAQSKTFTLGQIGGEYSHTLTEAEMPAHSHNVLLADAVTSGENQSISAGGGTVGQYGTDTSSVKDAGGSKPHNNIQPFVAVGIWLRLPDNYVAPTFSTYWTTDEAGMNKVSGFSETDNIYLWIEASGISGSYPISLINVTATRSASTDKLQYFIDANTATPTSLANGKNMVYALQVPNSGYFSGNIDLTVDVRYTDTVINQAKRITGNTTISDTVQGMNETVFVLGLNQTTGQPKVIKTQGSNGISVVNFNVASDSYYKYLTSITLQLDNSIDPTDLFINAGWQYSTEDTFIWQSMFSSDPAIQGKNSIINATSNTVTFNADTRTLTIVAKDPRNSSYGVVAREPLQIILSSDISVVKNNSTTDRYDNVNNPIQRPFTGLESWATLRDSQ